MGVYRMFQKNDEFELKIEDLSVNGEGIGHANGVTFFIKDALIGDVIRAKVTKLKKSYGYARLVEILTPSPDRVAPVCPHARPCGGCQMQELSYGKQLAFKEEKVRNDLRRIGGFTDAQIPMRPILGMENPWHYRNKAQFPVGTGRDGRIVTGFYAGRTHSIIANRDCAIGHPCNRRILDLVIGFMEEYGIPPYDERTGTGLVRHILIRIGFATGEIMVCLVINGDRLPREDVLAERLFALTDADFLKLPTDSRTTGPNAITAAKQPGCEAAACDPYPLPRMTSFLLNTNTAHTNVILGDKVRTVRGQSYITDRIGDLKYQISAKAFYQVNPVQTEKLYQTALTLAALTGAETVWDLYCGIGTISLFLAKKAKKVYGVEIVPEAIEDAKQNAKINGITNAEFFAGKAEEILPAYVRQEKQAGRAASADVVVVDPPRKGCDAALLDTILSMHPDRIVYVSCDPATLARDLKILCAGGYTLQHIQPVDQFPHSGHVETVCLLGKRSNLRKPDAAINSLNPPER